jgi:hypothetical protein
MNAQRFSGRAFVASAELWGRACDSSDFNDERAICSVRRPMRMPNQWSSPCCMLIFLRFLKFVR